MAKDLYASGEHNTLVGFVVSIPEKTRVDIRRPQLCLPADAKGGRPWC